MQNPIQSIQNGGSKLMTPKEGMTEFWKNYKRREALRKYMEKNYPMLDNIEGWVSRQ